MAVEVAMDEDSEGKFATEKNHVILCDFWQAVTKMQHDKIKTENFLQSDGKEA